MEKIAPGFRFYPTEEELVSFYLRKKLQRKSPEELHRVIPVIDIHEQEPWHLPKLSGELCRGDTEQWFFFTPRQERETRGGRPNRTTASGYWKATGSPGYVYSSDNRVIGVKKNMVFYKGKAPTGRKTSWKMNEYRAIEEEENEAAAPSSNPIPKLRHEFSLCRVYVISGSFRAFDRRPQGVETRKITMRQVYFDGVAATTSQNSQVVEKKSILESSRSRGDHVDVQKTARGSANLPIFDGLENLCGWEQLDLLI